VVAAVEVAEMEEEAVVVEAAVARGVSSLMLVCVKPSSVDTKSPVTSQKSYL
jgi:hypothetical protein